MPIKLSGMVSGLDTDAIIKELVASYNQKTEKYEKGKTKLEWKQEAWKELNTKIYDLYSKTISNMRFSSAYSKKKTSVSDETKASVVAGNSSVKGTQTLEVKKLAASGYLTGSEIKGVNDLSSETALRELGIASETEFYVRVGENEEKISLGPDTTIGDVVKQLKNAGVDANFDETNKRFFINSTDIGAARDFKLTGDWNTLGKLGLMEASNYVYGYGIMADENSALSSLGISKGDSFTVQVGDGEKKTITFGENETMQDLLDKFKAMGITATMNVNGDTGNGYLELTSDTFEGGNRTKIGEDIKIGGDEQTLMRLGLYNSEAVKIDGADAEIRLNGATFTSNSNNFSINGLTITAKEVTTSVVNLVTDTDVDAVYNNIKDFFKQYNEIINEMDSLYNADSAKGYEPLTDEEKEALSEKEVEKWEEKIKKSLLRRDTTLNSVASMLKSTMLSTYEINGNTMSLASLGIKTGNYFTMKDNEKNAFHIDGDPDDSTSVNNDDKLKAAIAADPESVSEFFTKLANDLYSNLGERMKSTTLSSAFTVYNDKQMNTEMNQYDAQIKKWEKYVSDQEEFWYKKFTAMEKALAQLQSSTSALSGLLGG